LLPGEIMVPLWINADLCAIACFLIGGAILGLLGLMGKDRRGATLLAFLVLVAMAWFAILGKPAGLWAPPAGLAGFVLLGRASRSPRFACWCALLLGWIRSRRVQALVLLLAGPALAMGWVYRLEQQEPPTDDLAASAELHPFLKPSTPVGKVFTDRGHSIQLSSKAFTAEEMAALRSGEKRLLETYGPKLIRLGGPEEPCNCHGLTFTDGPYWIASENVELILEDNGYHPISEPLVNDVVIYRDSQGQIVHSGVVEAVTKAGTILVDSKWGSYGRYIHRVDDTPYGNQYTYYRTTRPDHVLNGLHALLTAG
jgi:hypothetical protein